mmetsp:Transcript_3318/g.7294  ORF Transcript_3318/g.7294 Transcript_3318/m.7294 type:complete len:243 (+) Transcript_3318:902-1630(+)
MTRRAWRRTVSLASRRHSASRGTWGSTSDVWRTHKSESASRMLFRRTADGLRSSSRRNSGTTLAASAESSTASFPSASTTCPWSSSSPPEVLPTAALPAARVSVGVSSAWRVLATLVGTLTPCRDSSPMTKTAQTTSRMGAKGAASGPSSSLRFTSGATFSCEALSTSSCHPAPPFRAAPTAAAVRTMSPASLTGARPLASAVTSLCSRDSASEAERCGASRRSARIAAPACSSQPSRTPRS